MFHNTWQEMLADWPLDEIRSYAAAKLAAAKAVGTYDPEVAATLLNEAQELEEIAQSRLGSEASGLSS